MQDTYIYIDNWLIKHISEDADYIVVIDYRLELFSKYYEDNNSNDHFIANKQTAIKNKLTDDTFYTSEVVHILDKYNYIIKADKYIEKTITKYSGRPTIAIKNKIK